MYSDTHVHLFRVIASLLVVAFHGYLYWATSGDQSERVDLVNQNIALKLLSFANLSVDGFIVLSGFLAGHSFLAAPHRFSLRAYLARKVRRILVPYWLTLLAIVAIFAVFGSSPSAATDPFFGHCPRTLALSLLLLNNFIGFGGCGVHLWSVAVQMHLFVIFGVACKAMLAWGCRPRPGKPGDDDGIDPATVRKRMAAFSAVVLVGTVALRIGLAIHFRSRFPPPPFDHRDMSPEARDAAMRYYHVLYFATPSRATNFFTGVLLSLLLSGSRPWSARASRIMLLVATSVTHSYLRLLASVDYRGGEWGLWYGALLFHGSPMASIVMALLLASAIVAPGSSPSPRSPPGMGSAVIRCLSNQTYLIYLSHPLVMRLLLVD